MAKNRFDIGEVVAAEMQQIMQSDEHKRIFFNKKASEKCCSCSSCGKDCPCDKCSKECKACHEDKGHVHDSNCAHDQKTSAVNEMVELLSKISAVQDELGLVRSSLVTMQALATMVSELRKGAQEDTNDVSFNELLRSMPENTREQFRSTQFEDPEIFELLRKRVQESQGDLAEEGVSADPASPLPSSEPLSEFGDVVIEPEEHLTWGPGSSRDATLWAKPSYQPETEDLLQQMPIPKMRRPDVGQRYVGPGENVEFGNLPPPEVDKTRAKETVPLLQQHLGGGMWANDPMDFSDLGKAKEAFKKLNALLSKQAQEDDDFEEETDPDEEAELAALMRDVPGGRGQMRGHELQELLMNEEDPDRELFNIPDEGYADDDTMMASDLDEELESGDFLARPEEDIDGGPGFNYRGPSDLYDSTSTKNQNKYRDPGDSIRVGPGEWKRFDDLSPEAKLEQEMGAGLHEQLDVDPDELTNEEVYPEEWEETPEAEIGENLANLLDKYDAGEAPNKLKKQYRFWND